ncbi:MAG: Ku protein [Geminicoccaceae bacterium]
MATPRATWKGHLKLALVSCPVRLFKATTEAEKLAAHFLHRDTMNRIRMVPFEPTLGHVARADLVSGYEVDGDRHIVLDEADFAGIRTPSDKTLSIESFVDNDDIDPIYFDQPYFLAPDGLAAIETFDVIRSAMAARDKSALARIVLYRRERMAVVAARGRGFVLTTLRGADEIRDPDRFLVDLPSGDPSTEALNLAEQLIAMRSGRFDPHVFKDRYQDALKALIREKAELGETGGPNAAERQAHVANDDEIQPPVNIAEAFRRSLDAQRKPPAKSRSKTPTKKPKQKASQRIPETSPS